MTAPFPQPATADATGRLPDGSAPVLVSGSSEELLRRNARDLARYVDSHAGIPVSRIAGQLLRTRPVQRYRAAVRASTPGQLSAALNDVADRRQNPLVAMGSGTEASAPVLVFPGQGSQYRGMGTLFERTSTAYRDTARRCDEAFRERAGVSPLDYLTGTEDDSGRDSGPAVLIQGALFTHMLSLAAAWRAHGIAPAMMVGHSQGEIAAACAAGAISLPDAVETIRARGCAVEQSSGGDHAMAIAAADRDEVESLLSRQAGWAQVSVINAPRLTGISGERTAVDSVVAALTDEGRFAKQIRVGFPAHTHAMTAVADELRDGVRESVAERYFTPTDIACFGAATGTALPHDVPVDEYWYWNLRNTVRFDRALAAALESGGELFIELSAHPTLLTAIEETADAADVLVLGTSVRTATGPDEFTDNLLRAAVTDPDFDWPALTLEPGTPAAPLPDFPPMSMERQRFWLPYRAVGSPPAAALPKPGTPAPAKASPPNAIPAPQRLVEQWRRLTARSMGEPRRFAVIDAAGGNPVAARVVESVAEFGSTAQVRDANDLAGANSLVIVLPENRSGDFPSSVPAAEAGLVDFLASRAWLPDSFDAIDECWLITVRGEHVTAEDSAPDVLAAGAAAGFRCLAFEHLGTAFRHLDLDSADPDLEILGAALHTRSEPELAVRRTGTYARRFVEDDLPSSSVPDPGHVVITGGTGNLGLEFCEHYARAGAARITLLSRSGGTPEAQARIGEIARRHAVTIDNLRLDLTDAQAVAELTATLTPADLIIHTAVHYAEREFDQITAEDVRASFGVKVSALASMVATIPRSPDATISLCSSLGASFCGRGQALYASTNRMLEAAAWQLTADGIDSAAVQWGQWSVHFDLGDRGASEIRALGAEPMPTELAIERAALGVPENCAVAAVDWDRTRLALEPAGYEPLFAELTSARKSVGSTPQGAAPTSAPAGDIREQVLAVLAEVIGNDDPAGLTTTASLVSLGLDSLQAIELRRQLRSVLSLEVKTADLMAGITADEIIALAPGAAATPASGEANVSSSNTETSHSATDQTDVHEVLDRAAATAHERFGTGLDFDELRSARADLDTFGRRAMFELITPVLAGSTGVDLDGIAGRLEFAPRHLWLLRRWLGELTAHGHLELRDGRWHLAPGVGSESTATALPTARSSLDETCRDLGYDARVAEFFSAANARLGDLAADRTLVQELLFPDGDFQIAASMYRDNLISRYLNHAAAAAVGAVVDTLARRRTPVRILEIGGGVGGTTVPVVEALAGKPVEYHFTDVTSLFLRQAKDKFAQLDWMTFGLLDINAGIDTDQSFDIVIAANVLHNAVNVRRTIEQLHAVLRPGGAVALIEAGREHSQFLTSLHFLMSPKEGSTHPGLTDVRAGDDRIFLTDEEWIDEFGRAGMTAGSAPAPSSPFHHLDQRLILAMK